MLTLAACAAPSVGVMGGRSGSTVVGAYAFDVNFKGSQAEAYRSNIVLRPKASEVFAAGVTAIEQISGCRVAPNSVRGDVAMVQAEILC
ncbi:hypothetical protein [Litoreibacter arenae]|nr:hypothetical protein [Litoreibacter arenae]